MINHPQFDPVAIQLGPLAVRWYGLMYLVGFALLWAAGRHRIRSNPGGVWREKDLDDALFYGILGTIIGGRLGYVLFYKFGDYLAAPWKVLYVWEGGMSFHGGLIGVAVCLWLLGRKYQRNWFDVTDFMVVLAPAGIFCGRMGNFINGELWGRPTDLPWGMVFPRVDALARHPSQLYEAALEGVVLLCLMLWFSARPRPRMAASGLFLAGYGSFRFSVEFARTPDAHIGFLAWDWLTMGQLLSAPMIAFGAVLLVLAYRRR